MKWSRTWRWLLLIGLLGLVAAPAAAEIIEEVVANVNGEVVTRTELFEREQRIRKDIQARLEGAAQGRALDDVAPTVLVDLINEKLLYQRAERMGLDFDEVFRSTMENIKAQNKIESDEELLKQLDAQGISMQEFRQNLLKFNVPDIMINLEVRQKISVTDDEIQAYYEEHPEVFEQPLAFTFREIAFLLSQHDVNEALRLAGEVVEAARSGTDFSELVDQHSEAPSKEQGGLVENLPAREASEAILEALGNLGIGSVSDPVVMPRAVMVLKLENIVEPGGNPLENAWERIELTLKRGKLQEELDKYLRQLWAENQILITPKYDKQYPTDLYR